MKIAECIKDLSNYDDNVAVTLEGVAFKILTLDSKDEDFLKTQFNSEYDKLLKIYDKKSELKKEINKANSKIDVTDQISKILPDVSGKYYNDLKEDLTGYSKLYELLILSKYYKRKREFYHRFVKAINENMKFEMKRRNSDFFEIKRNKAWKYEEMIEFIKENNLLDVINKTTKYFLEYNAKYLIIDNLLQRINWSIDVEKDLVERVIFK